MKKLIIISIGLVFLFFMFVSCEEYYTPEMEPVSGMLVIESKLTNDPAQNFVKLKLTQDFYNTGEAEKPVGAQVDLIEELIQTTRLIEVSPGYFTFPKTPVSGKRYELRVTYDNDIYESGVIVMPPPPVIDTLYTRDKTEQFYTTDAYGVPSTYIRPGREINIDAPLNSQLEYYRFSTRSVLQWVYNPTPPTPSFGPPPPAWYGWKSISDNGTFNLAGPKEFSTSVKIQQHPLEWLAYNAQAYLDSDVQIPSNWIMIIDEYGITKDSYKFHEQLNKQITADGSLFDPVQTQIYGNMRCKTNASKIALGFFDLCSYKQYRYFVNTGQGSDTQVIIRKLTRFYDIPGNGYSIGNPPVFWEYNQPR